MSSSSRGTPFTDSERHYVDQWSLDVYDALKDWSVASPGKWTRWDPGYLLLEIEAVDNEVIDPILLDTADDELTVTFGHWETHLPEPLGTGDADGAETAEQAKKLVGDWLTGQVKTAVLTDKNGKWCGSMLLDSSRPQAELDEFVESVRDFKPTKIEIRGPKPNEWTSLPIHSGL